MSCNSHDNANILFGIYQDASRRHQAVTDFRAKLLGLLPIASGAGILVLLKDGLGVEKLGPAVGLGFLAAVLKIRLFLL